MINILLSGCNGKMGQVITNLVKDSDNLNIIAGYDVSTTTHNFYPVFSDLEKCLLKPDIIIDFSCSDAFDSILKYSLDNKVPIVVATTGLSDEQILNLKKASLEIPVFNSSNMSLGVNLLANLVKKAATVLENDFDIEIIEKHHNQKIDAPSGTAITLADSINSVLESPKEYVYDRQSKREKRTKTEIGMHAIRGGSIIGEHTVIFAGNNEIIELTHKSLSREVFASGSLTAAKFLIEKQPGLYGMDDLISS